MEVILSSVYAAIDEANAMRKGPEHLRKSLDTPLIGSGSQLDSLGFVNFIVALEMSLEQQTGVVLDLANTQALSQESSPFRTVGALAEYIARLLEEKRNGSATA